MNKFHCLYSVYKSLILYWIILSCYWQLLYRHQLNVIIYGNIIKSVYLAQCSSLPYILTRTLSHLYFQSISTLKRKLCTYTIFFIYITNINFETLIIHLTQTVEIKNLKNLFDASQYQKVIKQNIEISIVELKQKQD